MFRGKLAVRLYLNWFAARLDGYIDGEISLAEAETLLTDTVSRVARELGREAAAFTETVARRFLHKAIRQRHARYALMLKCEQAAKHGNPLLN